mmetsp:Transcript_68487/g.108700  ORF Transcript_68487/g.108700 Transcript_68487/m.108700 type:complete len:214 (-) Transcript_68487:220-861(-)
MKSSGRAGTTRFKGFGERKSIASSTRLLLEYSLSVSLACELDASSTSLASLPLVDNVFCALAAATAASASGSSVKRTSSWGESSGRRQKDFAATSGQFGSLWSATMAALYASMTVLPLNKHVYNLWKKRRLQESRILPRPQRTCGTPCSVNSTPALREWHAFRITSRGPASCESLRSASIVRNSFNEYGCPVHGFFPFSKMSAWPVESPCADK